MRKHCCDDMTYQANFICDIHKDPFNCPDKLVYFHDKFDEYGLIIHDGGTSSVNFGYCPWCGTKLAESKRDLWFDTLENLGFDDPFEQEIPKKFNSDEWYRNK